MCGACWQSQIKALWMCMSLHVAVVLLHGALCAGPTKSEGPSQYMQAMHSEVMLQLVSAAYVC
jgi:hypothetical protein